MDKVARTGKKDRAELFLLTADRMRLHAVTVEKDFWVCWLLKQLFTIPEFDGWLVFKGGTSLSKCFNLIRRFSEDIDLAVDFEKLGFTGERDPRRPDLSHTKRQPLLDTMLAACRAYVAEQFMGILKARIQERLGEGGWTLTVSDDPNIVEFEYPAALDVKLDYIRPKVVLELGTHAEPIPKEPTPIQPFAAEQFPKQFVEPSCNIPTVVARRTFWEKATILHAEYHRPLEKRMPPRYSRHYADVAAMARAPVKGEALSDLALLLSVVVHKDRFYHAAWAKYLEAKPGTFRLLPRDERVAELKRDHQAMQPMFFGDPVSFEKIIGELEQLEREINRTETKSSGVAMASNTWAGWYEVEADGECRITGQKIAGLKIQNPERLIEVKGRPTIVILDRPYQISERVPDKDAYRMHPVRLRDLKGWPLHPGGFSGTDRSPLPGEGTLKGSVVRRANGPTAAYLSVTVLFEGRELVAAIGGYPETLLHSIHRTLASHAGKALRTLDDVELVASD